MTRYAVARVRAAGIDLNALLRAARMTPEEIGDREAFPEGRTTQLETAEGVTVAEVVAATDAELAIPPELSEPTISRVRSEDVTLPSMGGTP